MSLFLIGYRGSGKTSIGRKLADRLWWKFVDTDELIVQAAGQSIKDIFAGQGEPAFRDMETRALGQVCPLEEHIIALGGGALGREENRELLKKSGHRMIYLFCEPEVLAQRIQDDPLTAANRPHLTSLAGGVEEIRKMLETRHPIYRQCADKELDVTRLSIDEAVTHIAKMM